MLKLQNFTAESDWAIRKLICFNSVRVSLISKWFWQLFIIYSFLLKIKISYILFAPTQRSVGLRRLEKQKGETAACWMLRRWKPVVRCLSEVKVAICLMRLENDTQEYTLTTIIQCTCNTCIHSDRAHTPSHPEAHTSTEITQVLSCFVASIYSAGCVRTAPGGEWQAWGGVGVACWSWRVDSICIWHTDCTKYANRQTMTFAVLFFLWYCSLPVKSTKR